MSDLVGTDWLQRWQTIQGSKSEILSFACTPDDKRFAEEHARALNVPISLFLWSLFRAYRDSLVTAT